MVDIISTSREYSILLDRAVTGLVRLGVRLLHREDLQQPVLNSLQILLLISPKIMPKLYRQISYGLHELLQKCGAGKHFTIFSTETCILQFFYWRNFTQNLAP